MWVGRGHRHRTGLGGRGGDSEGTPPQTGELRFCHGEMRGGGVRPRYCPAWGTRSIPERGRDGMEVGGVPGWGGSGLGTAKTPGRAEPRGTAELPAGGNRGPRRAEMQPRAGRGGGSPGGVAPSLSARGSAGKGLGKVPASGQSPPGHCSPGFPAQGGSARTPPQLGRLLSCTPQPGLGASPHCPPLAGAPANKGMLGSGFVPPSLITALLGLPCPPPCTPEGSPWLCHLAEP